MPPKVKITKESILNAAIEITRADGWRKINARELAKHLACSTQPIFHNFENMEELKIALYERVETIYNQQMLEAMKGENAFSGMGLAYIAFSKNEKNLFQLLFMSDFIKANSVFEMIAGEENEEVVTMISNMSGLQKENARQLYINIWLVTHGIASMFATNQCDFTETEVKSILRDSFMGYVKQFRSKEGEEKNEKESS